MKSKLRKMLLTAAGTMLFISGLRAQSLPPFLSVQSVGSAGGDQGLYLKTDTAGNIYSSGFITASSATFGSFTLNAPPPTASFNYVAKQDASGTYQWAIALPKYNTAPTDNWKIYMTTDPVGNVYTTGSFTGSITFGSTTLTAPGTDQSTYITKQATDGSYTWAIMITDPGAGGGSSPTGIFADSLGSVYLLGAFIGTVDIDPGAGTVNLTASTTNGRNVYILKLNNAGDYVWPGP